MALAINTKVASMGAARHLMKSTNKLGTTFERLSSGLRINRASDDTAGLSIGTRMTAQVRGLNQAIRNANDAISLVQVAEGALEETTNAIQRMRELAIQSATDTMTTSDRADLQKEVDQLMAEIERISTQSEFNNQKVIDGTFTAKNFQVGMNANQTILVGITSAGMSALFGDIDSVSIGSGANVAAINTEIGEIDNALDSVSDIRAQLGAYQNRFDAVIANLNSVVESTSAARSRIMDADIAAETANLTKNAIMQQAGTAILAQANQQPQIALQLLG